MEGTVIKVGGVGSLLILYFVLHCIWDLGLVADCIDRDYG